jgi:integrase/recombinase XerD
MQMNKSYFISIYLDTRREKDNGKYPVKLRVFTSAPRIQKLYPTVFEFTENQFQSIWETQKPRKEYKELRLKLHAVEKHANDVADLLTTFTFEQFEKKLFRIAGDGSNVFYHYNETIERLKSNNQLSTASTYHLGLKSIRAFLLHSNGKEPKKLPFHEITPSWLTKYEKYMLTDLERSRTTVSMYLRTLRTIFNSAIADREINNEIYPFGKRKYQIPSVKAVKKALTKVQLKTLFDARPQNKEQEKARDFWFFSYFCNGMNLKDIVQLKGDDIHDDSIIFYRAKTINSNKGDIRPIVVYLHDHANEVIEKYGTIRKGKYVFDVIQDSDPHIQQHKKVKNFTRFINHNIKKLAVANGLPEEISSYWARHSFASKAIREGASMEFVSEALNHSNLKTTQGYFAGFEDESKKKLMESLLKF